MLLGGPGERGGEQERAEEGGGQRSLDRARMLHGLVSLRAAGAVHWAPAFAGETEAGQCLAARNHSVIPANAGIQ
ncbi:hypothetical protein D3C78_1811200 [compost metagenome]